MGSVSGCLGDMPLFRVDVSNKESESESESDRDAALRPEAQPR